MRFLPFGIDVKQMSCTVVGGGAVGTRKALTLLRTGADVTVVSPAVSKDLVREIEAGRVRWVRERFAPKHLAGARLVVMATRDGRLNARGVRLAARRGALACDASSARRSRIIFGALLEHHGTTIAAFTDGRDPGRARRTRDEIEALLCGKGAEGEGRATGRGDLLVLVAHGSRDPRWRAPLEDLAQSVGTEAGGEVRLAYAQHASPTLQEVIDEAKRSHVRRVRVLPLFMTIEGHVDRDIRPLVESLRGAYRPMEIHLLPPIGRHPSFRKVLVEIANEEGAR